MKKILLFILLAPILVFTACGGQVTETSGQIDTEPPPCQHREVKKLTKKVGILEDGYERIICNACAETIDEIKLPATKSVKILAIGNSFSQDATEYLYDIFKSMGVESIVVGNAFIAGCNIEKHYQMSQSGEEAYSYSKFTSAGKEKISSALAGIIKDENWDIITLQQASGYSGMPADYARLGDLIDYVKANATNPELDIKFHMTWAYHATSKNGHFEKYSDDQMTMYNAIISTVKSEVLTKPEITGVIPVGTAIQNLRTSYIGDTLHRDESSHLTYDIGRYTAALTWACYLTGASTSDVNWYPEEYRSVENDIDAIREAIASALATPYAITESTMTSKPDATTEKLFSDAGLDVNDYAPVDWAPNPEYCWNSTKNAKATRTSGYLYYTASRMFTKDELPAGTVIIVDEGYQYRPEGWTSLDAVNASSERPKTTSTALTVIDDDWWGEFNYRAFNLSKVGSTATATAEDTAHFRIYIPKN